MFISSKTAKQNNDLNDPRVSSDQNPSQAVINWYRQTAEFDDPIEAWKYGPVVPNVYQVFSWLGSDELEVDKADGLVAESKISLLDREFIRNIVTKCNKYDTFELVTITHNLDAWVNAYNSYDQTMPIETIGNKVSL